MYNNFRYTTRPNDTSHYLTSHFILQVPIFQPRSDGNNNFLCALLIAATQHIPEVTVFFGAKLFRGTRYMMVYKFNFFTELIL